MVLPSPHRYAVYAATRVFLAVSVFFVFVGKVSGQRSSKKHPDPILVTIGGTPIHKSEFVHLYQKNHAQKEEEHNAQNIQEYFDRFIHFKLKVREAESRGMASDPDFHQELNTYKETLRRPYTAAPSALDSLTKLTYERLKEELKAAHILIALPPDAAPQDTLAAYHKALAAREKLTAGTPFDQVAREISEDPSAKVNGGSLGYFTALQMVFPFEEVAYSLPLQEISMPVRSRYGYHLIKVEDRRAARGEREVSHLMISGEDQEARSEIEEVYRKAMGGAAWDELCKTYSHDVATKDKGGRLRPFGPGALASAPAFEEAAFALEEPGNISGPVRTSFGWHLIRLERKIFLPPFSEMAEPLKKRIARDERMNISHYREMKRRKQKLGFAEDENTMAWLNLWAADSTLYLQGPKDNSTLFTIYGKTYKAQNLLTFVKGLRDKRADNSLLQSYEQFIEKILIDAEDSLLQATNPGYKSLVDEYREGMLLFSIMEKEIWNRASEDTLGQRQYYEKNRSNYQAGQRVKAAIFSTDERSLRDELLHRLRAGDTLAAHDLNRLKAVRHLRTYKRGDLAVVDAVDWTTGIHPTEAAGMYYLVEIKELLPPGQATFDEVRAQVVSDYQDHLEEVWVGQLKRKYSIHVNTKVKERMIQEMIKNQPRN